MPVSFDNSKPFKGLKVVDLSSVLAGPLAGSFFAELGAEVTKIENKLSGGDATRQWKLPAESESSPYSAYYFSANYGKNTMELDLTCEEDQLILNGLLSDAHLVISNFQKAVASKLGLLPDSLRLKYPSLIIAQLSAYEFDDPRAGYDLVMQGETGWISMTGTDQEHLSKLPVALIDIIASHQLKEAILIALWKKSITGTGSVIHVSLFKSSLSALANQASNFLMVDHIPGPIGTLHPNIAPYGDIFTDISGKKFMLAVGSDAQFKKLWKTLNFSDENYYTFETNSDRLKNRAVLQKSLQHSFSMYKFDDLAKLLEFEKIPFCAIKNLKDVFNDTSATEMVRCQEIGEMNGKSMSNIAFKIS